MLYKTYHPPSTQQIYQHQSPHFYCRYLIDNMTELELTNEGIGFIIKQLDVKDEGNLISDGQLKYGCNKDECFGNWNKLYLQNLMRIGSLRNDMVRNKGYEQDKSKRNSFTVIDQNSTNFSSFPLIKQVKNRSNSIYHIYCRECGKKYKKMYPFSYQNIQQFHPFLPQNDIKNLFKIILLKIANIFLQLTTLSQTNNSINQKKKNQQDFNVYILKCQCQYGFPLILSSDGSNPNNKGCQKYWQIVNEIIRKISHQPTSLQKQINLLLQKINNQKQKNVEDKQFLAIISSLIKEMGNKSDQKYKQNIKYTQQTHNTKQQDSNGTNTSKTISQPINQDLHIKMILSSDRNYDIDRNVKKIGLHSNNNKNTQSSKKIRQYLSERKPLPTFTNNFSLSNFVLQQKHSINQPDGQYYSINSFSYRPIQQKKQKKVSLNEQKIRKKKSARNQIDSQQKQTKNSVRLSSSPINGIKQIRNKIKKYNSRFLQKQKQKQNKKVPTSSLKKAQATKTKQKNLAYSESVPWQQILEVSKFINEKYTKKQNPSAHISSQENSIKKDDRITRDSISNIEEIKLFQKIEQQEKKQQKLKNQKIQNDEECTSVLLMIDQQLLNRMDPIVQNINEIRQLRKKYKMVSILQIYLLYKKFFYMRTALLQNLTNGQQYGYSQQKWSQIRQTKKIGQKIKEIQSQNKQILVTLQKMHKKVEKQIQLNKKHEVIDPSIIKIHIQNQSAYEQFIYKMLQKNTNQFKNLCRRVVGDKNSQIEGERLVLERYGISILLACVDQLPDENYQEQILTWVTSYYKKTSSTGKEKYIGQIQQILKKIKQSFGIADGYEVQISDY